MEFRIFVGQPHGALWSRLGFQISYQDKPVLAPSWIGLDFRDQEPYLGENPGLMSSESGSNPAQHYNYLIAHYMQNGTLGRQIDVEARAYDDGIAFRYFIPRTNPVADFYLRDEATQFNFARPAGAGSSAEAAGFRSAVRGGRAGRGLGGDRKPGIRKVSADVSDPLRRRHADESAAKQIGSDGGIHRSDAAGVDLAGGACRSRPGKAAGVGHSAKSGSLTMLKR